MPESFSQTLLKMLQPMLYSEASHGNALTTYITGIGDKLFQLIEDWASDTPDGKPGYSLLVDATRVPDEAIAWLGQFVGVSITAGQTPADQRSQLIGLANWRRGTVAALQAAPIPFLTGGKSVIIKERDTSPYHFEVITQGSETPDSAKVLAALLAQKPAGLVMNYVVNVGQKAFTMRESSVRGTVPDSLRLVI